jgi:hypothetical protein
VRLDRRGLPEQQLIFVHAIPCAAHDDTGLEERQLRPDGVDPLGILPIDDQDAATEALDDLFHAVERHAIVDRSDRHAGLGASGMSLDQLGAVLEQEAQAIAAGLQTATQQRVGQPVVSPARPAVRKPSLAIHQADLVRIASAPTDNSLQQTFKRSPRKSAAIIAP